jgi:uncharacterized surface protein with fasciclin (FAS1) repeats
MAISPSSLLLALFLATGLATTDAVCSASDTNSITEIACSAANAGLTGTLCALLSRTNLDQSLSRNSDYFVFAPTNAAFAVAGTTAGVTNNQIAQTLQYHVSADSSALSCGVSRNSILNVNGLIKATTTRCDTGGTLLGQDGNVRIPTPSSPAANFVDTEITACNGRIRIVDQVLGFGPAVYNFANRQPCSFYSKSCKGAKGAKGRYYNNNNNNYNVVNQNNQNVNGINFQSVYYPPKKGKSAKKAAWNNRYWNAGYGGNTGTSATPLADQILDGTLTGGSNLRGGYNYKSSKYGSKSSKKYKYGKRRERQLQLLELPEIEASSPYEASEIRPEDHQ